ncbi:MAG: 2-amino-4-hydroxy-6-hydroxymethyldihydropteridine diphosphokinase [Candidatus Omnitrophota bacterium]|nr:2-amino-4-hydroxy-6-hydroxymethyldihydropteridine diphosphokinase [Candidatus Omnitrophota bacterium]
MARIYIGIGSNLADRRVNIEKALNLLREVKNLEIKKISSLHETEPVGGPPEQGNFLNAVLGAETSILPLELLAKLKSIEKRLGRGKGVPDGPRPIDLDILFYDDVVIKGKELEIPHPRLHERFFALKPLVEIAPDLVHPILNKQARQLLAEICERKPF